VKTEIAQLLHVLGHGYGGHGQTKRAIVLLILASWLAPEDAGVLRTLAYIFLQDGEPEKALSVINKLNDIEGDSHPALSLLRSRALKAAGREEEAEEAFSRYVELRNKLSLR
jgi:type III secretion protein Y